MVPQYKKFYRSFYIYSLRFLFLINMHLFILYHFYQYLSQKPSIGQNLKPRAHDIISNR